MADRITFSWEKRPRDAGPRWRSRRIVKRNGVEVAYAGRSRIDNRWHWVLTAKHRDGVGFKNTAAEGRTFIDQAEVEADIRAWLREHPLVGVAPAKEAT